MQLLCGIAGVVLASYVGYGTIAAGQRKRQSTRPGAVGFITDSEDDPLGYFIVDDRTARAMVPENER